VPLLNAGPLDIPKIHARCAFDPCVQCSASRYLTGEDWRVVKFYSVVQDQVVNQTPLGVEGGRAVLTPRLEGWLAACELYRVGEEDREDLVTMARAIFDSVHGRNMEHQIHLRPAEDMLPPDIEALGSPAERQA